VVAEELSGVLSPLLASIGIELFDVQIGPGTVIVTVDRPGGVDLDALALATRAISAALDEHEPFSGRYTLEVSSPGLERRLRTPGHFAGAVGEMVSVRTRAVEGRRVRGVLAASDERGIVLSGPDVPGGELRLLYEEVEQARTVFEWGSKAGRRAAPSAGRGGSGSGRTPEERVTTS
jgi:ribosome maturation factor RimP